MTTVSKAKSKAGKNPRDAEREARKAALKVARGSLKWVNYSVDDFLREKREEVKRENGE